MITVNRSKKPFVFEIDEDGIISSCTAGVAFFYELDLIKIRDACIKTIKLYKKHKMTDSIVDERNDYYIKEFMSRNFPDAVKQKKDTYVYIMYDENTGYFKIGRSLNPTKRERTLQSEKASIKLIATYPAKSSDEGILHKKFEHLRVRGEWFDLSDLQIAQIRQYFKNK